MFIVILFVICFLLALIPAHIASKKGHSHGLWFLFGFFFWIIALPVSLLIAPNEDTEEIRKTKRKCPYCAEFISAEARICKHCGRELGGRAMSENVERQDYVSVTYVPSDSEAVRTNVQDSQGQLSRSPEGTLQQLLEDYRNQKITIEEFQRRKAALSSGMESAYSPSYSKSSNTSSKSNGSYSNLYLASAICVLISVIAGVWGWNYYKEINIQKDAYSNAVNIINALRSLKAAGLMYYADNLDEIDKNAATVVQDINNDRSLQRMLLKYVDNPKQFGPEYSFRTINDTWVAARDVSKDSREIRKILRELGDKADDQGFLFNENFRPYSGENIVLIKIRGDSPREISSSTTRVSDSQNSSLSRNSDKAGAKPSKQYLSATKIKELLDQFTDAVTLEDVQAKLGPPVLGSKMWLFEGATIVFGSNVGNRLSDMIVAVNYDSLQERNQALSSYVQQFRPLMGGKLPDIQEDSLAIWKRGNYIYGIACETLDGSPVLGFMRRHKDFFK